MNEATAGQAIGAYVRGYDTWHLPAMLVTRGAVRYGVQGYVALRAAHDDDFGLAVAGGPESDRVRAIELIAVGVSSAADAAQLLAGANPLTTNYVQWLTLARRIAVEAHQRSESVTTVVTGHLGDNRRTIGERWSTLRSKVGGSAAEAAVSTAE